MKKAGIILGMLALCTVVAKAQKSKKNWDGHLYNIDISYKMEAGKPVKKETYVFKSYKDKEDVLQAVYKKMSRKIKEGTYTEAEIEKDRKKLVTLMKGKVEESVDA